MDLIFIYQLLIGFVIIQRLIELYYSKKNIDYILSQGGKVIPEMNYLFMVILHFSWLAGLTYNILVPIQQVDLDFNFIFFLSVFVMGQCFRILAMKALGKRWTTRIAILPNVDVIDRGIFRYIKHPNYIGVILEILALPLMIHLYLFSIFFSVSNIIILYFRVKKEEESLRHYNNYSAVFGKSSL